MYRSSKFTEPLHAPQNKKKRAVAFPRTAYLPFIEAMLEAMATPFFSMNVVPFLAGELDKKKQGRKGTETDALDSQGAWRTGLARAGKGGVRPLSFLEFLEVRAMAALLGEKPGTRASLGVVPQATS